MSRLPSKILSIAEAAAKKVADKNALTEAKNAAKAALAAAKDREKAHNALLRAQSAEATKLLKQHTADVRASAKIVDASLKNAAVLAAKVAKMTPAPVVVPAGATLKE